MVSPDKLSMSASVSRQDHSGSHADEGAALEQLRGDGPRDLLGDQVVERPFGADRTFHRGSPEDVGLQNDDGPVEVREGERFAGRCGVGERRDGAARVAARRRLRLSGGHAAAEKHETQHEALPSPVTRRCPGSRAVRHAGGSYVSRPRARTGVAPASLHRCTRAFATGPAASLSGA